MTFRRILAYISIACVLTVGGIQAQNAQTLRPLLWQAGMTRSEVGEVNVFRRFLSECRSQMEGLYNEVLALKPLPASALGGNHMVRYPLGQPEVKLFPVAQANDVRSAPV